MSTDRRPDADPDRGTRDSTGNPRRWARTLSAVAPVGAVAVAGVGLGSIGRRRVPRLAARLEGAPIDVGVDADVLSAVAGGTYAASLLLGLLVACAVGWLVLSAAARIVASAPP
ncbi:hypothetical protein ACFPM1_11980 [Halorubrum rubrum]|uniref:Uncharacterized protein n=1 Tax=Halorubrum rubrum TaxID=1126240 RepID=A0ABD5R3P0_9EURY|nr:hypothetical protein [Halorubrum rubrum]